MAGPRRPSAQRSVARDRALPSRRSRQHDDRSHHGRSEGALKAVEGPTVFSIQTRLGPHGAGLHGQLVFRRLRKISAPSYEEAAAEYYLVTSNLKCSAGILLPG